MTELRPNDTSTLSRGCGGVGILWKKSFDVTPIGEIDGFFGFNSGRVFWAATFSSSDTLQMSESISSTVSYDFPSILAAPIVETLRVH